MNFVTVDLEWNGSYVKKVHGYFNEIIEIGAVKLDENLREIDRFQAIIRPAVSKKLTALVTDLTNITDEDLSDGGTFTGAMAAFRKWIGKKETVILTWSTTDLLVFLENYRYFCKTDEIPFMTAYVDLQAYYQRQRELPASQQVGLSRACEELGINGEDVTHHRALGDAILTGRILQKVYEADSFLKTLCKADDDFYRRITFKNTFVTDPESPLVKKEYLRFCCSECGKRIQFKKKWRPRHRAIAAEGICTGCEKKFTAQVQIKQKYDSVDVKRKLLPVKEVEDTENNQEGKKEHVQEI